MRSLRTLFTSLLTLTSCLVFASSSQAQGVRYEVTEHTSSSRVVGWEHTLTQRDPNLANWHWEPISTSNHQFNVKKIQDPNQPGSPEPVAHYAKTPYVKPIHVDLPTVVHKAMPTVVHTEANISSHSDVGGKLLRNNSDTPITAQAKPVATYKDYAHGEAGYSSNSAQTNLTGSIVHKAGRRSAYSESPCYY
jgi:hypothetical protein